MSSPDVALAESAPAPREPVRPVRGRVLASLTDRHLRLLVGSYTEAHPAGARTVDPSIVAVQDELDRRGHRLP